MTLNSTVALTLGCEGEFEFELNGGVDFKVHEGDIELNGGVGFGGDIRVSLE